MTGKEKSEILKSIRVMLAELNKISYTPHACNNIGDCKGTCSVCDAESKWLLSSMKVLEKKGFPVYYSLLNLDDVHSGIVNIECVP